MLKLVETYKQRRESKRLKAIEGDLKDWYVNLVEVVFQTIDGETVKYEVWVMLDKLYKGLKSFNELQLLEDSITIDNISYVTKNIVKLESRVIKEGYVKPEVKEREDDGGYFSRWECRRYCPEEYVENIVEVDSNQVDRNF